MVGEATESERTRGRSRRRGTSVTGVIGEILISIGVVVLLYVAWQMWVGDWIYGAQNNAAGKEISQQWENDALPVPDADPNLKPAEPEAGEGVEPVILPQPADAEIFGIMRIPRFGPDYATAIAGGVSRARTLDHIGNRAVFAARQAVGQIARPGATDRELWFSHFELLLTSI